MYTVITPPCIRRAREVYTAGTRPRTGRVHGRVTCRVHVTRRPYTRPVNTSSPAKTAHTRPYNGRAVYTARSRPCIRPCTAVYGPCTRPVYTTRVHDCVRAVCMDFFGRVHGAYTAPYTGRVHGRVHGRVRAVHTAVYTNTTRIRPRTRVYVSTCTRAVYTAV